MSNELIRKTDVLDLLNDFYSDFEDYSHLFDDIDFMIPVNAVELPCKIGDIIYIIRTDYYQLTVNEVVSITVRKDDIILNYIGTTPCDQFVRKISTSLIGEILFFSKDEAEAALEKMKEENK